MNRMYSMPMKLITIICCILTAGSTGAAHDGWSEWEHPTIYGSETSHGVDSRIEYRWIAEQILLSRSCLLELRPTDDQSVSHKIKDVTVRYLSAENNDPPYYKAHDVLVSGSPNAHYTTRIPYSCYSVKAVGTTTY